ncbi:heterokaryon incompatibility protein-domain-containing protein [Xylariaceae sp. FL0662B]|nr:heterokaryon incompatibility protein-domain-containing protein [Xylariaceae sp. FL0662B]
MNEDINKAVMPHQLCIFCQRVAVTFTPDVSWKRDMFFEDMTASEEQRLRKVYEETPHMFSKMDQLDYSSSARQLYVALMPRAYPPSENVCTVLGLFDVYPGLVASEYRAANRLRALSMVVINYHPRHLGSSELSCNHPSLLQVVTGTQALESQFRWSKSTESNAGEAKATARDLQAYPHDLCLVLDRDTDAQPYAALSYRWGNAPVATLTHHTHEAFFNRIELSSLPKTIHDAIQFCRKLSVRYLWVDALCIIQGDAQDFVTEISRMGAIYSSSLLTIAAADSVDSSVGLHRSRFPLYREDCLMRQDENSLIFFGRSTCSPSLHSNSSGTKLPSGSGTTVSSKNYFGVPQSIRGSIIA